MSTPTTTTTTTTTSTATALTCTRHPDRETGLRCQRCERPWCFACLTPAPVGSQCVECMQQARPPSAIRRVRPADFLPHSAVALLAALCLGGFLTQALTPDDGVTLDAVELRLAYSTVLVWTGEYYRFVTSLFLHADLLHLLVSLTALWVLGTRVERRDGAIATVLVFLGTGIAGGAATYVFATPDAFAIGASGAVYGLSGMLIALARNAAERKEALVQLAVLTIAVALVVPNLGHVAHAGGFAAGVAFGLYDRLTDKARTAPAPRPVLAAAIVLLAIVSTTIAVVETNAPGV